MYTIPSAIFFEAFLSFIGIGKLISPPIILAFRARRPIIERVVTDFPDPDSPTIGTSNSYHIKCGTQQLSCVF